MVASYHGFLQRGKTTGRKHSRENDKILQLAKCSKKKEIRTSLAKGRRRQVVAWTADPWVPTKRIPHVDENCPFAPGVGTGSLEAQIKQQGRKGVCEAGEGRGLCNEIVHQRALHEEAAVGVVTWLPWELRG